VYEHFSNTTKEQFKCRQVAGAVVQHDLVIQLVSMQFTLCDSLTSHKQCGYCSKSMLTVSVMDMVQGYSSFLFCFRFEALGFLRRREESSRDPAFSSVRGPATCHLFLEVHHWFTQNCVGIICKQSAIIKFRKRRPPPLPSLFSLPSLRTPPQHHHFHPFPFFAYRCFWCPSWWEI
jgi:hypothetical protein